MNRSRLERIWSSVTGRTLLRDRTGADNSWQLQSTLLLVAAGCFCCMGSSHAKVDAELNEVCREGTVDRLGTAEALRALLDQCKSNTQVSIKALGKLNALPLPSGPRITTPKDDGAPGAVREQVQLEATIYFATGEAYPTDEGFEALSRLIERVNLTEATIESVSVLGGVDGAEAETALARGLALGRAEVLHRYMVAAGAQRSQIAVAIRTKPVSGSASPQGTERSARVILIVVRRVPPSETGRIK